MKNILLYAYCEKNLGDDLFIKILVERYKDVNWHIITDNKEYLNIFKNNKNVKILNKVKYKLYKKINHLVGINKYDILVMIGGSMFMQNGNWKGILKEREYLFKKFNQLNKEIFIIGSNFGPYYNDNFIEKYKDLFNLCTDICFRDMYSYNLFKDMKNIRVAPDVVFQMGERNIEDKKLYKPKKIGLSIINLKYREGLSKYYEIYNLKIKEIIEKLIERKYEVTLFSFCKKEGDEEIIDEVVNSVKCEYLPKINKVYYDGDINTFLNNYKEMHAIIGTRFHSIILSQNFKQNVFPIIYSEKTYNTLVDIRLSKNYVYIKDIEELDIDKVIYLLENNSMGVNDRHSIIENSFYQFKGLDAVI